MLSLLSFQASIPPSPTAELNEIRSVVIPKEDSYYSNPAAELRHGVQEGNRHATRPHMVERDAARVRRRGLTFQCADPFTPILRRSPSGSRKPLCILQQADGKKEQLLLWSGPASGPQCSSCHGHDFPTLRPETATASTPYQMISCVASIHQPVDRRPKR